jgi:hypothetical protein
MPFNIVDVKTGTLVRVGVDIVEFDTADEATAYAKARTLAYGHKYKIKAAVIDDSKWIAREQQRMNTTYIRVPFADTVWFFAGLGRYTASDLGATYRHLVPVIGVTKTHFPHVSMSNKSMLAYTESSEKGAKDVQTQIKPGAYLSKYFSYVLSPDEIADLVRDWQCRYADCELKYARTPADIVRIYQNGPRSCMSGAADEYSTHVKGGYLHPCEVYGQSEAFHGDLTMAYLEGKNGISARCLVWEEKKQFGRIYGDSTLLYRELQALGYTQGVFNGARIAKIKVGTAKHQAFLMPYIDGWSYVMEQPDHFVLKLESDVPLADRRKVRMVCSANTNGRTEGGNEYICAGCEDEVSEDEVRHVPGHDTYCRYCYEENFIYCERLCRDMEREGSDQVVVRRTKRRSGNIDWIEQTWCAQAIEDFAFQCPVDGAYFANDLAVFLDDGRKISLRAQEAMTRAAETVS